MKNMENSEKHRLRERMKRLRDELPGEYRRMASGEVAKRLVSSLWYEKAGEILVYSAIRSEVDLSAFCERARADGKRLFFPKVQGDTMDFFQVDSERQLCPGAFGVREPRIVGDEQRGAPEEDCGEVYAGRIWNGSASETPILVPGVAFARAGARIGYGKGYYDRYLAAHEELIPVGICFDAQLVDAVPAEPCDRPMAWIVTERETLRSQ